MTSDYRSYEERDADASLTRARAANVAANGEAERRRRDALDAPKIAAALAKAEEIERNARQAREADDKAAADRTAARAKAEAETLAEEQAERRRRETGRKLDAKAASAVHHFAIVCFLVALPLQIRAFWDPARPWNLAIPLMLETAAWVALRLAEAAIANRRLVWPYVAASGLFASIAAGINVADGVLHPEIGVIFGLGGGVASLSGPGMWMIHRFGARAKNAKATWSERKLAEQQAKQAEAELESAKVKAEADLKAKQLDVEARQKIEADKRAAHEAKVAADKAAAEAELTAQDEQRKALFAGEWEQYERILAKHPLGSISRDRAWEEARKATEHPDVWMRYEILSLNAPANTKSSDLWADAWASVKGLPVGQTIESLAEKLAAREYVNQTVAEHLDAAGHLAVEELLEGLFGPGGEGGGTPAKGRPKGPSSGPTKGATGLVRIGQEADSGPRYKDSTEPLSEDDLEAARKLREAAPDQFSTPAVARLLRRSKVYAQRVRDAVNAEQKQHPTQEGDRR